jgi:CheY-like chemotaxis protein/tRNA A-37 threonylcarbamoyl transferase component Bud32
MARIILIDDDVEHLDIMSSWLTHEQHTVDVAPGGPEGWQLLQINSYDLVILDWDMPELTGIEVLRKFRQMDETTAVLMLTGRAEVDEKAEGLDSGASDYLTKPFHMKELSARVRAALRGVEQKGPKPLGTGNKELLENAGLFGTSLAARYEFLCVLGEGAAGTVYKARHPGLDKLVAIKILHYHGMKEEVYQRFEQEARIVSRLSHPGLATVHDYGQTERKRPFMVMDFVDGQILEAVLQERDHLPVQEALSTFSQICDAMAHAHEKGVVHRDLNPSNIMITPTAQSNCSIKVLDFGCGKLRDLNSEQGSGLTQEGRSLGTPSYMSPEQVRGEPVDERSDIYSLACVLYEALTGYVLHQGDNVAQTMLLHLEEDVPLLAEMNPELTFPDELERCIAKALEKEKDKRYRTMLELKSELELIQAKSLAI